MTEIESIRAAILEGADGETVGALPLPQSFRAAVVRADEQEMFAGLPSEAKDPRKSTHVEDVAVPELAPDEAYIAVMASAINFNTVWTSIFEPLPTFQFLQRLGKESVWGKPQRPAVPGDGRRGSRRDPARRFGGAELEPRRPGHAARH